MAISFSTSRTVPSSTQPDARPHIAHPSSSNDKVEVLIQHTSPPSTAGDARFNTTGADNPTLFSQYPEGKSPVHEKVLYLAALYGDWQQAEQIFDRNRITVTDSITHYGENTLHIAAGTKHSGFVEKLIGKMAADDVALKNIHENTALCLAATSGVVRTAELLVQKNEDLPLIPGSANVTPLFMAISYKRREMVSYLLSVTHLQKLDSEDLIELFIATIHSGFYDISLQIFHNHPELAVMRDKKNNNETALDVLARKPSAMFSSGDEMNIWKKCLNSSRIKRMYSCKDHVMKTLARELVSSLWDYVVRNAPQDGMFELINDPTRLLHDAARAGNVEFLILLIRRYPHIAWEGDDDGKTIFHIAVENRLENVFNLIHQIGEVMDFSTKYRTIGKEKYNMLHLAAKLPASNHLNRVSGAALQMQRELVWFKEVEKLVLPSQLEAKCEIHDDAAGSPVMLTPRELFTKEHKELRKAGEEWMKSTANSCMVVSTLIATVVFAAVFTVPGGSDNNTGTPIFRQKPWFTVFVISDAAALISSSTSILMFLSILTSRYAEADFLQSLPSKLLFGLASLFISIVCMVVAFTATFFMLYQHQPPNILVPAAVAAMAVVPVTCFCALQFKLWIDTFHNTYLSKFLFKSSPRKLF